MKDAEKIKDDKDLTENETGKKIDTKGIDFTKTNPAGAVDSLNDAPRIQNAGTNIEIVGGSPELLEQPLPEAGFTTRIVDVSGAAPIPSTNEATQQAKQKTERVTPKVQEQQPYATLQSASGPEMPPPPPGGNQSFNPDFDDEIRAKKSVDEDPGDDALATADLIHRTADSMLVRQIPKLLKYSQSDIDKLHEKKKLNKFVVFNFPDGSSKSVSDVFNEHNKTVEQAGFEIPEQWIQEHNPLLAKILKKKSAVLSDEARYAIGVATLAGSLLAASISVKRTGDNLVKQLSASSIQQPAPAPAATVPAAGPSTPDLTTHTAENPIVDSEKLKKEQDDIAASVRRALKNVGKKKTGEETKKPRSKKDSVKVLTEEAK